MRKKLASLNGVRSRFQGIFVRFGTKNSYRGYPQRTILLKEIKSVHANELMADHLWFMCGKRFDNLNLQENDSVMFDARVTPYEKGYRGFRDIDDYRPIERDYRLSYPTNVVKIKSSDIEPVSVLIINV